MRPIAYEYLPVLRKQIVTVIAGSKKWVNQNAELTCSRFRNRKQCRSFTIFLSLAVSGFICGSCHSLFKCCWYFSMVMFFTSQALTNCCSDFLLHFAALRGLPTRDGLPLEPADWLEALDGVRDCVFNGCLVIRCDLPPITPRQSSESHLQG